MCPLTLIMLFQLAPCLTKTPSSCSPPLLYLSETNLKVRQSLTVTGELGDNVEKLADFDGKISV